MRNYYYLAISLPDLEVGHKPLIRFEVLMEQFQINLTKNDLDAIEKIRLYFDLVNLERTLNGESLSNKGNLNSLEIAEALKFRSYYPEIVFEFFDLYKEPDQQKMQFAWIYARFFQEYCEAESLIQPTIVFEQELRLFLLGYRSLKFKREIVQEFRFEGLEQQTIDLILSQKIEKKNLDDQKLEYLIEKLKVAKDALEVRSLVASFRFDHYKEIQNFDPFTIHGLIAYMMQLFILEELEVKEPQVGLEIFHDLLKDKNEYID